MPSTGGVVDSTIISMKPIDVLPTSKQSTQANQSLTINSPDEREVFNTLLDCMKDVAKFRQYIYYMGTSCDTTKLRNKIKKFKQRLQRNFSNQREILRKLSASINSNSKAENSMRRFEKCLCFTLASINYYEDLLHKFSILIAYFPLANGDRTNVVNLGFEDSTINADEVSFEMNDPEENETNRYIELLSHIQTIQSLRDEIEQIDSQQLRHHATSYSLEFVENMHKYTTDMTEHDNPHLEGNAYTLRRYFDEESNSTILITMTTNGQSKSISTCSMIPLLGRNYDESISLASKYNQFLQNDRRLRLGTTNGTRQRTPSSFYRQNDRVQVERSDQVCVYRRRSYLCQRKRHDPYALPIEIDSKISEKDFNDSIDETSADKDLSLPIDETNFVQEQISSADKDSLRRRSKNSLNCSTCKIKFKNKILFQNHLEKCQIENESSLPNSTKNDTLSVSLLKQETQTATTITLGVKPEAIVTEINSNQTKCQKNRLNKKSNSKTALIESVLCCICGQSKIANDELIRCSICDKSMHVYQCLNFKNETILKMCKTYRWECSDCKKCSQCQTVEQDDELLFCDLCDRAYHMECLNPALSEPPPGEWFCRLCI